jgi:hypothetical protein
MFSRRQKLDDVPDDQEVAGEVELLDQASSCSSCACARAVSGRKRARAPFQVSCRR